MSFAYNTSIVRDGLVFHTDMSNTAKSYVGKPTNNLIATTPLGLGVYAYASGPVTTSTTIISQATASVNRYTVTSAVNTARARIVPSLAAGTTYSFSCYIRYNGTNTASPSFSCDASKGSPEGGGNNNTITVVSSSSTHIIAGWYYLTYTFTVNATPTGYAILTYGVVTGSDTTYVNNTFDVYNEQFETGIVSPYVNGQRTSTQSVYDLTNNSTITVNNLTYNTDNTYSFNNTQTSALSCPDSSLLKPINVTLIAWVYMSTFNPLNDFDGTYPSIVWKCYDANSGGNASYGLSLAGNGGAPRFTVSPTQLISATPITMGVWTMLAGVYSSGSMKLYKNAVLDTSTTGPANIPHSTQVLSIGTRIFNGTYQYPWNGKIGVVKVYNRALTGNELTQNFDAYRNRYGV